MRSFTIAFIAATLATFTSAVPVDFGVLSPGLALVGGSAGDAATSVTNGLRARDLLTYKTKNIQARDYIEDMMKKMKHIKPFKHHGRSDIPSVSVIFGDLTNNVQPYTDKLASLDSSDVTVAVVADIVADIRASIEVAIPELQALVNEGASVVFAGPDGRELTAAQIAGIVGVDLRLILGAAAKALVLVEAEVDIRAKVEAILYGLGLEVTSLVQAAADVVVGLSLAAEVKPVEQVIIDLQLYDLATLCGLDA